MAENGFVWLERLKASDRIQIGNEADWQEVADAQPWLEAPDPEPDPELPRPTAPVEVPAIALAVSREQAASLLSVSVDHLERHVIPHLRVVQSGRRQLIPVRELENFLSANAARALK